MQALQINKEHILELVELEKPSAKEGELLVQVKAAGLNPSDILNAKGGFAYTTFPRVPGRDFAGIVEDGPSEWKGKRVFGTSGNEISFTRDGAHAEYMTIPVEAAIEIPDELTFAQAATIGVPFSTAALCLDAGETKKDDVVLVLGANGAVGSAAVALARAKGCTVLTGARNDPAATVDTSADPELNAIKEKGGADVIVDTVGAPSLTSAALQQAKQYGRLVMIAAPRKGPTDMTFDMLQFYRRGLKLIGVNSLRHNASDANAELRPLAKSVAKYVTPDNKIKPVKLSLAQEYYTQASKQKVVIVPE
ncbi:hypothetical protein TRICI_005088 [Trichomonascus ciferrii]|uniref:Enoyl reductase (ER) domain-containing protein n=1 Tax=Trichomonascus ciferrii TaxID=44093 RepID=A0A642UY69_9ASCO|nr:hypothetical protein TRICI_005088 [Trichomonascus ciferrii]